MKDETKKRLIQHLAVLGALALLCAFGCPVYRAFHIRCPGCGLTRAWLYFLQGDLPAALEQHALFLFVPGWLLLLVHWETGPIQAHRRGFGWAAAAFGGLLLMYHVLRTIC